MLRTIIHLYFELGAWDGGLSACKRMIMVRNKFEKMNDIVLLGMLVAVALTHNHFTHRY
jgi:hypothetical protein